MIPAWLDALGLVARWANLTACVMLAGAFAHLFTAGRSDRATALAWEQRLLAWARALALIALVTGILAIQYQTAVLVGAPSAALDRVSLARVILETHSGRVWLVRHAVLLLLGAFLLVRPDVSRSLDWSAVRGESLALGGAALVLIGLGGHAAAVEPGAARAITADLLHLAAVGVWAGGLLPLAALLRSASREAGADARPYAVMATRRFSRGALAAIIIIVVTGIVTTLDEVGDAPALLGTRYGHLLLLKLALFLPVLILAALNRRLLPALSGEAATVGRPAMRRLGRFVRVELLLVLGMLALVAIMTVTPPARHEQPVWPFSFRFAPDAVRAGQARVLPIVGGQLAVLGIVAIAAALFLRARRLPLLGVALALLAVGAGLALPPITVDAYPTTYRRPSVPYSAASITAGSTLYATNCARCHGPEGRGDGPGGRGLPRPPADLSAPHTALHTAGDMFWWITHGIPAAGMPAFGSQLDEEDRWDLVNVVRALGAAAQARSLGASVEPGRAWLIAPDFTYAVGPGASHTLKEQRGRRIVLLVVYSWPASRQRIGELAEAYNTLATLGVEVVAVPADASPDAIHQLDLPVPVLFPVVTDGAADIVTAYGLFGRAPHAEFLVDRQGYLRARWLSDGSTPSVNTVLAEVQELNSERVVAPLPAEHVH